MMLTPIWMPFVLPFDIEGLQNVTENLRLKRILREISSLS